jgi:hypothetical protein
MAVAASKARTMTYADACLRYNHTLQNADMPDAASLVYEPLNEYKPIGPNIGIVDGPLE